VEGEIKKGAVTDMNGIYSLEIPANADVSLYFSRNGMIPQKIAVNNQQMINVKMQAHFNKALVIVDGKEVDDISSINPDSIESMSVLKGDSAIAIYGEKGKNGVVIITTRN